MAPPPRHEGALLAPLGGPLAVVPLGPGGGLAVLLPPRGRHCFIARLARPEDAGVSLGLHDGVERCVDGARCKLQLGARSSRRCARNLVVTRTFIIFIYRFNVYYSTVSIYEYLLFAQMSRRQTLHRK